MHPSASYLHECKVHGRKLEIRIHRNHRRLLWNKSFGIGEDGLVSEEVLQAHESDVKALIDGYLNLLVNFGVIGALLVALLFQFTVNDLTVVQTTVDLFGETASLVIKYIFLTLHGLLLSDSDCSISYVVQTIIVFDGF